MNKDGKCIFLIVVALVWSIMSAYAQIDYRMPDLSKDLKLKKLQKLLNDNPKDLEAHYWYLNNLNENVKEAETQYQILMKRYPREAVLPYQLGHFYLNHDNFKAWEYLNQAIGLDPKIPQVWLDLYSILYFNGDDDALSILKKGIDANPDSSELLFRYAYAHKTKNMDQFKLLMSRISKKKKIDKFNVRALRLLAEHTKNFDDKVKFYKEIKDKYLMNEPSESSKAMLSYYSLLLQNDITKTKPLVYDLLKMKTRPFDWGKLLLLENSISAAQDLIISKKPEQALEILNNIKVPYFFNTPITKIYQLKSEAIAALYGDRAAVDSLIYSFSKNPTVSLYDLILKRSGTSFQDSINIKKYMIDKINGKASKASSFRLKNYLTNDSISLDSLHGCTILLSYWYPQCGPCRAEMPHFEDVLRELNDKNILYITINIQPAQNSQALNLIRSEHYTFTPLEEIKNREKGNLDNMGAAPANFIIDKNGYLIFSDFSINEDNKADLELMLKLVH